ESSQVPPSAQAFLLSCGSTGVLSTHDNTSLRSISSQSENSNPYTVFHYFTEGYVMVVV
uniref:Uncharacterized protein n=1 Tax=Aegilops tauschii subsp. strangulata TaxID=200361 RepID=A0A453R4U9_AEGTS